MMGAMVLSCWTAPPGENDLPCSLGCAPGQVVHCGMCVTPIVHDLIAGVDPPCTAYACDDQSVCAGGASCMWVAAEYGWRCRTPEEGGLYYGLPCEPGDPLRPCPAGGFCRDNWGDPSLPEDGCFPGALSGGTCAVLGAHADFCDSTWPDEQCYPCNYLSDCIDGRCLASCSAAGDCPCEPGDPYECHQGHCKQCRSEGEPCAPPLEDCCGGKNLECPADLGVCCPGVGAACSADADCCQTGLYDFACKNGQCRHCRSEGKPCESSLDCCTEAPVCGDPDDQGSRCLPKCNPDDPPVGEACDTGLEGECAVGVYQCDLFSDGELGLWCKPPEPSAELCDGLDNNCDGKVDDNPTDVGGPCNIPDPSGCQPGFDAPGVWVCQGGAPKCDIHNRFCGTGQEAVACGGDTVDGEYCGRCLGEQCISPDSLCTPQSYCAGYDGSLDCGLNCYCIDNPACDHTKHCWLPSEVGTCYK
jgi:hypothetical protein